MPRLPDDVIYVVVGEGPDRETIERAAAASGVGHRVRMLGEVSRELLAAAYRSADLFAMPNVPVEGDIEGFGLVALEAAAAGLPVVASALEGIADAIQHGGNGLLVPAGDTDAWAGAVSDVLALSREERQAMGQAFARFTAETYAWSATAARYLNVIEGVTRGASCHAAHAQVA